MKTAIMPDASSVDRLYKTSANSRLQASGIVIAVYFFGFAALLVFGLMGRYGFSPEVMLASAILIGIGIYGIYLARGKSVYLALSEKGIEFRTPEHLIESDWDNIQRLDFVPTVPKYGLNVIFNIPVPVRDSTGLEIPGLMCSALPLSMFPLKDTVRIRADFARYSRRHGNRNN